jgi:hypothetical protein
MGHLYERRILNADNIEVRHSLSDPVGGIITPDDVTLELSNTDGFFNGQDLRGTIVNLTRFDREDGESVSEFSGAISEQTITDDQAIVRLIGQDQDVLQTLIPKRTVTTSVFPLAHADQGAGRSIPIIFGETLSPYQVPYVTDNTSISDNATVPQQYCEYLIGEGTSYTQVSMYRNTIGDTLSLVSSMDYILNTTSYPGLTVAQFSKRQAMFTGGLHTLYATAIGMQPERNFIAAIRTTLTNSTWGLGQKIVETTFSSAESKLAAVGSLACDGVLVQPRPAIDILNQLCQVRGMTLSKTSSGAWTIALDQGSSTATFQSRFGHGAGQPWNNVITFNGFTRPPIRNAVSNLLLNYAVDYRATNVYRYAASRSVSSRGRELRLNNDFIQTGQTADKVADYLSKRLIQGDLKATFSAGQDGRNLNVGDLILYDAPHLDVTSRPFRVTGISRKLDVTKVDVEGWASSIYSYTAASSIPPDVTLPIEIVWSTTTPAAVTSLSVVGSGVVANGQGGYSAFQTLGYAAPHELFAQTFVRQKTSANSQWTTVAVDQVNSATVSTRIDGLITGQTYDYRVSRVNIFNPSLYHDTDITSKTAPTDKIAPSAPTSLTVIDQQLKSLAVTFTPPPDLDVAKWHWEIRTVFNSFLVEGDAEGSGLKVQLPPLNQLAYNTTYRVRLRGHDYSGNVGAYSSSLAFRFSQVGWEDLGGESVTAPAIGSGAITTPKRQVVNQQSADVTAAAGGGPGAYPVATGHNFTVSTGMVNMFCVSLSTYAENTVWCYANANSSETIGVVLLNISPDSDAGTITVHYW